VEEAVAIRFPVKLVGHVLGILPDQFSLDTLNDPASLVVYRNYERINEMIQNWVTYGVVEYDYLATFVIRRNGYLVQYVFNPQGDSYLDTVIVVSNETPATISVRVLIERLIDVHPELAILHEVLLVRNPIEPKHQDVQRLFAYLIDNNLLTMNLCLELNMEINDG
jgi:hypothetical protein